MNAAPRMAYTPRWPPARRSRSQAFSAAGRVRCHGPGIPQAPESGLERRCGCTTTSPRTARTSKRPSPSSPPTRAGSRRCQGARPGPAPARRPSAPRVRGGGQTRSGSSPSSGPARRGTLRWLKQMVEGCVSGTLEERVGSGGSCARVGTTCRCGLSGSRNAAHRDRPAGPGQEQGPQVSCRGQFHSVCALAYRRLSFDPVAWTTWSAQVEPGRDQNQPF